MNDKIIKQGIGYDAIRHLTNGIIAVRLGYRWGLVDDNNNELMPIIYDYISYEDRQLWARFKDYLFYIPLECLPLKYDCIYKFGKKGCAGVIKNGKHGVVDNQYKELIPCQYDNIHFGEKAIHAERKANNTNNENTDDIFSYDGTLLLGGVYCSSWGKAIGEKIDGNLKYGIIDENYNFIIPCENKSIQQVDFGHYQYYGYYH